jgi:hypothetical protein
MSIAPFSDDEIAAARRLKSLGLPWSPAPGHYVFDEAGLIEPPSPFRPGVYFILDLRHFLRRSGTVERLREAMAWLPTWADARGLLRSAGVPDAAVAEALRSARAVETGTELTVLYDLIARTLPRPPSAERVA